MTFVKDLDKPLLRLTPTDNFTLRHGCGGVHGFGGIGQGKTTGLGKSLAGAYLRAGMGGLIRAVKPEEVTLWQRYAKEHHRSPSLVLFDEGEGFNFLSYELGRHGLAGIGTVTECLLRVLEAAKRASSTVSQRGGDAFWEESNRSQLHYSILPIYAGRGSVSISDIVNFISSAPSSRQETKDPQWQRNSFMYECMNRATHAPKVPVDEAAMRDNISYWAERFPAIPEKTRGNMVISLTTVLDRFKHGRLNRAFCGKTTIVPELSFHGAVIVMAMPTLIWNEDGIIAQQLFKYMWQRAVLNRNSLPLKHQERPVFLWSDEAQETVSSYDAEFQSMCRASKCCTVYLTQSLPNYYAKMGGDNPRDAAHALVGKFITQVFHSNSCPETNEYASRTIGKVVKRRANYSRGASESVNLGMNRGQSENSSRSTNSSYSSSSGSGGNHSSSHSSGSSETTGSGSSWGENRGKGYSRSDNQGYTETMENAIEPGDFARILKTGGPANNNQVTAVWFQAGRIFKASGNNFMLETFNQ